MRQLAFFAPSHHGPAFASACHISFLLASFPKISHARLLLCVKRRLALSKAGEREQPTEDAMPRYTRNLIRVNPFTGRKRKLSRRSLSRKRRYSLTSTVKERSDAHDAMKAANKHMECSILELARAAEVLTAACENLATLSTRKKKMCAAAVLQLMHKARAHLRMAVCCIQLDSDLLDLPNNENEQMVKSFVEDLKKSRENEKYL